LSFLSKYILFIEKYICNECYFFRPGTYSRTGYSLYFSEVNHGPRLDIFVLVWKRDYKQNDRFMTDTHPESETSKKGL